jgi:hypothetical protein
LTAKVQEVFVAKEALESDTLAVPAIAVIVPPGQVPLRPLGAATKSVAGNVSVNATPVSATVLADGLVSVNVSDVDPLGGMLAAPKALLIDGGATTARLAEAVPPVPPFVEVTDAVVLFFAPADVPVTFTAKVHEELLIRAAPDSVTLAVPAMPVIVPPLQLPVIPLGVAMLSPDGSASVKPTPVNPVPGFGFDTVKVNVVFPFSGTLADPNTFVIVGGQPR